MKKKNLVRFYCIDCDNAWLEILEHDVFTSKCEYCKTPQQAEEIENENNR
jgi:hypothetical protein